MSFWTSLSHFCSPRPRVMSGSTRRLKVSQELVKTYAQRRNSHLVSAAGDAEQGGAPDPYAFVEGDEEFTFAEKKDKAGTEKDGNKKYKVGPPSVQTPCRGR